EISSPYNPVHLTHVGINHDTGEFTGLPKEWQQLLQEAGISKQEQKAHPQAVLDIIGFYTDSSKRKNEEVWHKFKYHNAPYVPPQSHKHSVRDYSRAFENIRAAPAPPVVKKAGASAPAAFSHAASGTKPPP